MTDTVADALIRIKNGYLARRDEVLLPYSKFIEAVCKVLKKEGYILDYKQMKAGRNMAGLEVNLRYESEEGSSSKKKPVLSEVKRISRPGLRVYKSKNSLPTVLNGLGIAIITTPKGVMSDKEARKEGVGGEVVAYVW